MYGVCPFESEIETVPLGQDGRHKRSHDGVEHSQKDKKLVLKLEVVHAYPEP